MSEQKRRRKIRDKVIFRDGPVCCYCNKILSTNDITMEHIVPDSKRGTFNTTNLTVSCSYCNNLRGNKAFFDYCKRFNWDQQKLNKYKKLYLSNLEIKILNLAKETCLNADEAIPNMLIQEACQILKTKHRTKHIDFSKYEKTYQFDINFNEKCNRKKIKKNFELLIKIIESNCY